VVLRYLQDFDLIPPRSNVNVRRHRDGYPLGAIGGHDPRHRARRARARDIKTALVRWCIGGRHGTGTIIERVYHWPENCRK